MVHETPLIRSNGCCPSNLVNFNKWSRHFLQPGAKSPKESPMNWDYLRVQAGGDTWAAMLLHRTMPVATTKDTYSENALTANLSDILVLFRSTLTLIPCRELAEKVRLASAFICVCRLRVRVDQYCAHADSLCGTLKAPSGKLWNMCEWRRAPASSRGHYTVFVVFQPSTIESMIRDNYW